MACPFRTAWTASAVSRSLTSIPGKTFVYEFELRRSGSFMYHPHSDEMVQMAMGMMGMFVVHPRDPKLRRVDRDFVFIMSSYLIDPGTSLPKVVEMTDFNMWTWNSRVFPGIDPLPVRLGDRVRVRIGNLTMTNHPIHLHGHSFAVTCTDGGWVPESARWPEVTTDVPVGAIRAFEVVADAPGDWAFHCHKSHHTMNAMGHNTQQLHRRQSEANWRRPCASSCRASIRWARPAWPRWDRWKCRCPITRCR